MIEIVTTKNLFSEKKEGIVSDLDHKSSKFFLFKMLKIKRISVTKFNKRDSGNRMTPNEKTKKKQCYNSLDF